MSSSSRGRWAVVAVVGLGMLLYSTGFNPAAAQTPTLAAWRSQQDPGLDGTSEVWQRVPALVLTLTPQEVAPPMGGGTVRTVAVRALHWNDDVYVMVEWPDDRADTATDRPEHFSDAAAIQMPSEAGTSVPTICMGQADQAVNVWQWRADTQEGFPEIPAHGYVDLYQSTDDLFYPGRSTGNIMSNPAGPVQDLVAGGYGSLQPAAEQTVSGHGIHAAGKWSVVFRRALDVDGSFQTDLEGAPASDIAFAVWDGDQRQRNGIKSVSAFAQLLISAEVSPDQSGATLQRVLTFGIFGGLVLMLLAGVGTVLGRALAKASRA